MQAFKAHARNGRLVLDEPTDLPDGAEVHVLVLDERDLDAQERAALDAELEAGERELDAGLSTKVRAVGSTVVC